MAEFVAVIHGWFMDSNGFSVERIDAETEGDARAAAEAMAHRSASTFNRTAVQLLVLGEKTLLAPRRLTWKERLTGWIDAEGERSL